MKETTLKKYEHLKGIISEMESVIVAYSGGVDSSFLLKVANDVLGKKAKAVLAVSPTYPEREYKKALEHAKLIGIEITVIKTNETENEHFIENPVNRCYFCKSELFDKIVELADKPDYKNMVDGSNFDDRGDHRPGMRALHERKVRSPLREAELTKQEIRDLSKMLGLPTWNKEALACLSSRFPYGERIDIKKLRMVDQVEEYLYELGFGNIRARHSGKTVKIEVNPDHIKRFFDDDTRHDILKRLKEIGYTYITVDLEGYRQGSLNEILSVDKGMMKVEK